MPALEWRMESVPPGAWTEHERGREYFPHIKAYFSAVDIDAYSARWTSMLMLLQKLNEP